MRRPTGIVARLTFAIAVIVVLLLVSLSLWWSGVDPKGPGEAVADMADAITPWRYLLQGIRVGMWIALWCLWSRIAWRLDERWAGKRNLVIGGVLILEAFIFVSRLGA